jgi:hypothetical protein
MGTLLGDCDKCLFDSVAQEVNKLAGTVAIIYQFEETESSRDPVWDEEIETVYKKNSLGTPGIECPVFFRGPDRSYVTGEEGFRLDKITELEVAKADLAEKGLRRLQSGDIIKVWENQYYDVTESHTGQGYINDEPTSSMVKFNITRRTKALPEGIWGPQESD